MTTRTTTQTKQYTLKNGTIKTYDSNITYYVKNAKSKRVILTHTPEQKQEIIDLYIKTKGSYASIYKEISKGDYDITYYYVVKYINNYKKSIMN